ncbi:hypothetical protein BSL78_21098 [Apostichopus japonicus]|uniref:Uncharacterized protein n=1 Tax=Stichopus japonicus TaxID=307972 RepID=A0A2G8K234_STIJA|nr:hypothetical protein BSL78_21098 [Apostichopus japonicus]
MPPLVTTRQVNLTMLPTNASLTTTVQPTTVISQTTNTSLAINTTLDMVTSSPSTLKAGTQTGMTSANDDVTSSSMSPGPPILAIGDGVISEEVAVSLVLVAVFLFASTCLLLFLTLILHCCKCCCNGSHHLPRPSYINPDARLAPEEYMHLNLNGRRGSVSTETGTEFLTLSDRGGTRKSQDRSSFSSLSGSRPTTRLLGRRTSRTFPGVRDIKNFLHDIHVRRVRTFSSHVTAAELDVVRRRLESASRMHPHRDRTRSTILLERSGSTVRPVSEISEHFYYSLFPEAHTDYPMDSESSRSSLVDFRVEVPARVGTIELLSHPSRAHRRRTNSSNLRIIWTSEGGAVSDLPQVESQSTQQNPDTSSSEMVENEIYESYSDDEVKC